MLLSFGRLVGPCCHILLCLTLSAQLTARWFYRRRYAAGATGARLALADPVDRPPGGASRILERHPSSCLRADLHGSEVQSIGSRLGVMARQGVRTRKRHERNAQANGDAPQHMPSTASGLPPSSGTGYGGAWKVVSSRPAGVALISNAHPT